MLLLAVYRWNEDCLLFFNLTDGGDLREAQVDIPQFGSHSSV
jgi:hypothetical protein